MNVLTLPLLVTGIPVGHGTSVCHYSTGTLRLSQLKNERFDFVSSLVPVNTLHAAIRPANHTLSIGVNFTAEDGLFLPVFLPVPVLTSYS